MYILLLYDLFSGEQSGGTKVKVKKWNGSQEFWYSLNQMFQVNSQLIPTSNTLVWITQMAKQIFTEQFNIVRPVEKRKKKKSCYVLMKSYCQLAVCEGGSSVSLCSLINTSVFLAFMNFSLILISKAKVLKGAAQVAANTNDRPEFWNFLHHLIKWKKKKGNERDVTHHFFFWCFWLRRAYREQMVDGQLLMQWVIMIKNDAMCVDVSFDVRLRFKSLHMPRGAVGLISLPQHDTWLCRWEER